jgi:hypothetical protein
MFHLQEQETVKGVAAPDKELLPLWCFKLKLNIIMDVQQLWKLLEVDALVFGSGESATS